MLEDRLDELKNFESIENKNMLRRLYKTKRSEFLAANSKASEALAANLLKVLPKKSSRYWASYRAFNSEANPTAVESMVDISWCYPVVDGDTLTFYPNKNQKWAFNQFQIEEPAQRNERISLDDIEGVLLPGLAFDLEGQRLGYGKAYYDKTLKNYKGIKIGVAYSVQVTESLPNTEDDIPVDIIVTEKEVLKIHERKLL